MTATKEQIIEWASQEHPICTAPNFAAAMEWMVRNDDLFPPTFGSYKRHYASPRDAGRALRGHRGTLLAIFFGWRPGGVYTPSPNNVVLDAVDMWRSIGQPVIEVELP